MNKLKKNDEVIVIAGRDKGRTGKITQILNDRVLVGGVNLVNKCVKPNPQKGIKGEIAKIEASIHISNVQILNQKTNKADKVGIKTLEDNTKVRVYKSTDEAIED